MGQESKVGHCQKASRIWVGVTHKGVQFSEEIVDEGAKGGRDMVMWQLTEVKMVLVVYSISFFFLACFLNSHTMAH
jgi:hypothetical protein